jgi:hypothetical protein
MHSNYDDKFDAMKDKPAYQLDDWESIAKEAQRQVVELLLEVRQLRRLARIGQAVESIPDADDASIVTMLTEILHKEQS